MDTLENTPGFVERIGPIKNVESEPPARKTQRNNHSAADPDNENAPASKKTKLKQVLIVCCEINNSKSRADFTRSAQ